MGDTSMKAELMEKMITKALEDIKYSYSVQPAYKAAPQLSGSRPKLMVVDDVVGADYTPEQVAK